MPALCLLLGTVAGLNFSWFPLLPAFLSASVWVVLLSSKRGFHLPLLLVSLFILGGHLSHKAKTHILNSPFYNLESPDYVDISGSLYRNPEFSKDLTRLYIKTREGRVIISVRGIIRGFYRGDRIEGSARIYSTRHPCNFGVKRTGIFLAQGISAYGYSKSRLFFRKISKGHLSFLYKIKERAALKINSLPNPYSSIMAALLLGERFSMEERERRALKTAGIYHLMAISGAHVGIFLYFVWLISGLFTHRRNLRLWVSLASLGVFYMWMEGSPSIDRASLIAALLIGGKLLWRDIDYINLLATSMFVYLLFNPLSCLSPGFQLTYFVTLGLILFAEKFKNMPGIQSFFLFSTVAFLFSLPISLYHFHRVNLLSPFNNMIAATLLPFLILTSAGWATGLKFLLPPSRLFIDLLLSLDGLKLTLISVPAIPLVLILVAIVVLILSFRIKWFVLVPLLLLVYPGKTIKRFEVIFLDVGQGDSVLVKCPPVVFLYDGGGSHSRRFDVGEYITSPALWAEGIRKLDGIFVSHYHPDHAAGLLAIIENFPYKRFFYSEVAEDDPIFKELMMKVPEEKRMRLKKGDEFTFGSCKIRVLHPPPLTAPETRNDDSLVLLVEYEDYKVLLTGDISKMVENELLQKLSSVNLLKVAHHGSKTSSSEEFLKRTSPEISVVSCGIFNPYNVPAEVVMENLKRYSGRVLLTSRCGAIRISPDSPPICCLKNLEKKPQATKNQGFNKPDSQGNVKGLFSLDGESPGNDKPACNCCPQIEQVKGGEEFSHFRERRKVRKQKKGGGHSNGCSLGPYNYPLYKGSKGIIDKGNVRPAGKH